MFKQGGRYFIITSAATGWDPNQAQYFVGHVDRRPVDVADQPRQRHHLRHAIGVHDPGARVRRPRPTSSPAIAGRIPTSSGRSTSGCRSSSAARRWRSTTTPSGSSTSPPARWSVNDGFLPQAGWTLLSTDSEETQGENGRAINAFDGSSSTHLAHAVHGHARPPPARDPDRPRRQLRADRPALPAAPGQGRTRDGGAVRSSTRAPTAATGARPSRPARSTATATRSG